MKTTLLNRSNFLEEIVDDDHSVEKKMWAPNVF